jgi:hypothetical protein
LVFISIRGSHILDLQGEYFISLYLYWYHLYIIEPCMLELHILSQNVMALLHMGMLFLTKPYFLTSHGSTRDCCCWEPCSLCILGGPGGG